MRDVRQHESVLEHLIMSALTAFALSLLTVSAAVNGLLLGDFLFIVALFVTLYLGVRALAAAAERAVARLWLRGRVRLVSEAPGRTGRKEWRVG